MTVTKLGQSLALTRFPAPSSSSYIKFRFSQHYVRAPTLLISLLIALNTPTDYDQITQKEFSDVTTSHRGLNAMRSEKNERDDKSTNHILGSL